MVKPEIVRIECFEHQYADGTKVGICNTQFSVRAGDWVIITGPNGSGKTTLLHHIIGILTPTKGDVLVFGAEPGTPAFREARKRMGVVFQDVDEQLIAPTVEDDVAFSPLNYGVPPQRARAMVDSVLKELGIEKLRHKVPHYLSGGEKKKVALAGAVVMHPDLLVLDEALTNIDAASTASIIDYLRRLNKSGTAIIMTTHDPHLFLQHANKRYHIERGEIHSFTRSCEKNMCGWMAHG